MQPQNVPMANPVAVSSNSLLCGRHGQVTGVDELTASRAYPAHLLPSERLSVLYVDS